ncbi:uncharacterized protein DNG_06795 [Cephalotrichum gorgonifer]|uniref:BHLH domain-containing protein n=1 Tax=Cephalotrichum gorgonifer TaxID=2041049 RepID=A0AAE8SXM9_9PEZI|nr:uncharacterized protein DNG_06795 [Cephalotrichum gorgonifer]
MSGNHGEALDRAERDLTRPHPNQQRLEAIARAAVSKNKTVERPIRPKTLASDLPNILQKHIAERTTLKRTICKDVERARRNKLKYALDELKRLISQACCEEWPTGRLNSKIDIIECTIDYIVCIQSRPDDGSSQS